MTTGPEEPREPGYPQQPTWNPYGAPYSPPQPPAPMHPQATTALVLGIVGLAGTFICGITILLGPFAWVIGARAKREIAAAPGQYRGDSEAQVGMILGIVTTALLALALVAVVLVLVLVVFAADSTHDYGSQYDALASLR